MRKAVCLLYSPLRLILIIIFTPLTTLGYWFLSLLVGVPLFTFRKLLGIISRFFDPDICNAVDSFGHIISRDYEDWYRSPSQSIVVLFKLKGHFQLDQLREHLTRKVILKSDVNHNKLDYPELQQFVIKRMGSLFFKWDRSFNVANHVNIFSDKDLLPNPGTDIVDETKLRRIWEAMITRPYMKQRSLWDVHIVPNYVSNSKDVEKEEQQQLIILRLHHVLADGISVYKLLLTLTDYDMANLEKDVMPFRKGPPGSELLMHLQALFLGPTSIVTKLATGVDMYNKLHKPLPKKTGKIHIVQVTTDLKTIKNVSRVHLDVSFHTVLLAALTGAVRNYLLQNGEKIPWSPIRVGLPIPKPGHSYKLRNQYLSALYDLPVTKKTPRQRLFACEKRLVKLLKDPFVPFMWQAWLILGLFPTILTRFLTLKSAFTVLYSEIKGPESRLTLTNDYGKFELNDLVFSFGLGSDDLGILINYANHKPLDIFMENFNTHTIVQYLRSGVFRVKL